MGWGGGAAGAERRVRPSGALRAPPPPRAWRWGSSWAGRSIFPQLPPSAGSPVAAAEGSRGAARLLLGPHRPRCGLAQPLPWRRGKERRGGEAGAAGCAGSGGDTSPPGAGLEALRSVGLWGAQERGRPSVVGG